MVNPQRFKQSKNAVRAFEAQLVILEQLRIAAKKSLYWIRGVGRGIFFGADSPFDLKAQSLSVRIVEILRVGRPAGASVDPEFRSVAAAHRGCRSGS